MMHYYALMQSPVGMLALTSDGAALTGLYTEHGREYGYARSGTEAPRYFGEAKKQLDEYFQGRRTAFSLALAPEGTAFQKHVWQALQAIPYGETVSYKTLAARAGAPGAARAVGSANGKNPLCLIIPCHRVIAADGSLGGYSSGLHIKEWLLAHEAKINGARKAA